MSWAAQTGEELPVRFLLERSTSINLADNNGRTPVSWTAEVTSDCGNDAARILIEEGANIHLPDNDGRTPLL